jgi:hypothetical protein
MATTPNYGFIMPDPTDFVTNLPADFEIFGDEVDSRIKALNPETTLGDISYRSSTANTNTRLGIGTTGQVLTVSGGVPAWATPTSGSLTQISSTALSGASVTLSSIPTSYKHLALFIYGATWDTAASDFQIRVNNLTNNITGQGMATTTTVSHAANNVWRLNASSSDMLNTGGNNTAWAVIYDYNNAAEWKPIQSFGAYEASGPTTLAHWRNGAISATAAVTSLVIQNGNGYNLTGGTVILYGVN